MIVNNEVVWIGIDLGLSPISINIIYNNGGGQNE